MEPGSAQSCQQQQKKQREEIATQEFPPEHEVELLDFRGD